MARRSRLFHPFSIVTPLVSPWVFVSTISSSTISSARWRAGLYLVRLRHTGRVFTARAVVLR